MTDDADLKSLAPAKYLDREQWSAEQWFRHAASGDKPINPEWETYRAEVLAEHGLDGGGDE